MLIKLDACCMYEMDSDHVYQTDSHHFVWMRITNIEWTQIIHIIAIKCMLHTSRGRISCEWEANCIYRWPGQRLRVAVYVCVWVCVCLYVRECVRVRMCVCVCVPPIWPQGNSSMNLCCSVLRCVSVCCRVLTCSAVHGSELQCVAVCCRRMCQKHILNIWMDLDHTLQLAFCIRVGCNTLQHTATHYNTLQYLSNAFIFAFFICVCWQLHFKLPACILLKAVVQAYVMYIYMYIHMNRYEYTYTCV